MIAAIGRLLQSLLMGVMTLFKRAMCFLNRKRRDSGSILPTHVHNSDVIEMEMPPQLTPAAYIPSSAPPATNTGLSGNSKEEPHPSQEEAGSYEDSAFADWGSWDSPSTMTTNSTFSQKQQPLPPAPSAAAEVEPEPEPDYFSDLGLEPTIKKPAKVFVKPTAPNQQPSSFRSNRLAFKPESAIPMSAELGEWEDNSAGAWGEDDELHFEAAEAEMKESRRAELERRRAEHQRRNKEKEMLKKKMAKDSSLLATKLS